MSSRQLRSSPGPETGCSRRSNRIRPTPTRLRSSPGPETGCSAASPTPPSARQSCDPHPVRRPGAAGAFPLVVVFVLCVAILTRSGDRVQLASSAAIVASTRVAILTRSGDRVQRAGQRTRHVVRARCDPHPVRRPGAARSRRLLRRVAKRCDPHPVRRPGAASKADSLDHERVNLVAILTRSGDRVQPDTPWPLRHRASSCDPHPVRRPGAAPGYRSGPVPDRGVAILTRSGDRVQRNPADQR